MEKFFYIIKKLIVIFYTAAKDSNRRELFKSLELLNIERSFLCKFCVENRWITFTRLWVIQDLMKNITLTRIFNHGTFGRLLIVFL